MSKSDDLIHLSFQGKNDILKGIAGQIEKVGDKEIRVRLYGVAKRSSELINRHVDRSHFM